MTSHESDATGQGPLIGVTIAGRYRIERLIREDAASQVVAARHLNLDETVAIRFLRPELRPDSRAMAHFTAQAKALAQLKSEHVARVLDVGATLSVGPYLVLEYPEGASLAEVLKTEGTLPPARAVEYVLQACKALSVAHAAGVVHRELQPATLFLARNGDFETLKVVDFPFDGGPGERASAAATSAWSAHARTNPLSRRYSAPEAIAGEAEVDGRADIWSLGAILYELVTGQVALGPGPTALEGPTALALAPALRKVIGRCLEPERALRFQSVDELAAELAPLTTIQEVFRGRLTGSFSRQMLAAAAAQAMAAAAAAPRRPTQREHDWLDRLQSLAPRAALAELLERLALPPDALPELAGVSPRRAALEQVALLVGSVLVVAFGMVQIGNVSLAPAPPALRLALAARATNERVMALRPAPAVAAPLLPAAAPTPAPQVPAEGDAVPANTGEAPAALDASPVEHRSGARKRKLRSSKPARTPADASGGDTPRRARAARKRGATKT